MDSLTARGNGKIICALGVALAESIKYGALKDWFAFLLKIPCTTYHSFDKSTHAMLRINQSRTIGLMNDCCKMTALAEAQEFHEFWRLN